MIILEKAIKDLGTALKKHRKQHKLTQESLSDITGISKDISLKLKTKYQMRPLKSLQY